MANEKTQDVISQSSAPLASVCIVALDEESNLLRCLESLIRPVFPSIPFEILIIDQGSKDLSYARFKEFLSAHPSIEMRWISRSENHLGKARGQALECARGRVALFLDADCTAPERWIDTLTHSLQEEQTRDPGVTAVGGGNAPPLGHGFFYDSLRAVLFSFWGSMNSLQARSPEKSGEIEHLPTCNVAYDRAKVLEGGNFSKSFRFVGEDIELSRRLKSRGERLVFLSGLEVTHYHRTTLKRWFLKMYLYGRAQPRVAFFHGRHLMGLRALPLLALLSWMGTAFLNPRLALVFLGSYFVFSLFLGFFLAKRHGAHARGLLTSSLLVITHWGYALGELQGVFEVFRPSRQ